MTELRGLGKARIRTGVFVLLGLVVVFAGAGCGESGGSPQGNEVSASGSPQTSAPSPSPEAAASQEPGFPEAADGTNVRACYDGDCEILVTKQVTIALDPRFGFKTFSFDPADSVWRYTYPEGGGSGSLSFLEPPYEGQWAGPGASQSLALKVVASQRSRAVISLRPVG